MARDKKLVQKKKQSHLTCVKKKQIHLRIVYKASLAKPARTNVVKQLISDLNLAHQHHSATSLALFPD
jgi:hypothetical protein